MLTPVGSGTTVRSVKCLAEASLRRCNDPKWQPVEDGVAVQLVGFLLGPDYAVVSAKGRYKGAEGSAAVSLDGSSMGFALDSAPAQWTSLYDSRDEGSQAFFSLAARRTHHHARFARSGDGRISSARATLLPDLILPAAHEGSPAARTTVLSLEERPNEPFTIFAALAAFALARPGPAEPLPVSAFAYKPMEFSTNAIMRDAGDGTMRGVLTYQVGNRTQTAEIIEPSAHASATKARPGVLFVHWLGDAATTNHTEFEADAVALARRGAVCVLLDAMWSTTIAANGNDWFENGRTTRRTTRTRFSRLSTCAAASICCSPRMPTRTASHTWVTILVRCTAPSSPASIRGPATSC